MLEVVPVRPARRAGPDRRGDLLLRRQVNFGVTGDYDTAPDIDVLCAGIEHGMTELLAAAE